MSLPDRYNDTALARAWPLLTALVVALFHLAGLESDRGPASLGPRLRRELLRRLRPAEALARRLLLLLAREHDTQQDARPRKLDRAARCHRPHRLVRFSVYEPVARLGAEFSSSAPAPRRNWTQPRLLDIDAPYPQPLHAAPMPAQEPAVLARIRGLRCVLENPDRYAARLSRTMARRRASRTVVRRVNPLRPGWPPGIRSPHIHPDVKTLLDILHTELRTPPG